jgi:hypothetical protein
MSFRYYIKGSNDAVVKSSGGFASRDLAQAAADKYVNQLLKSSLTGTAVYTVTVGQDVIQPDPVSTPK